MVLPVALLIAAADAASHAPLPVVEEEAMGRGTRIVAYPLMLGPPKYAL